MNYPHILRAVFSSPWALDSASFAPMFTLLHSRVFAGEQPPSLWAVDPVRGALDPLVIEAGLNAAQGRGRGGRFGAFRFGKRADGGLVNHSARIYALAAKRATSETEFYEIVAEQEAALPPGQLMHIFGSGILGKHLTSMDEMCSGGLSVDRVQAALKIARDDDNVSAVMLHLDTPGGICYGMSETAALVAQIAGEKNIGAFCDSLTASAGVWCTCRADYFYVTPSADIGSVGVYSAFVNYVEWCKKKGIEVQLITDGGTYKGAGYPGTALSAEQLAKIQADVKACSEMFKADVRAGRHGISDSALQGQCFTGAAAVEAKFADALVPDLETALADLAKTI